MHQLRRAFELRMLEVAVLLKPRTSASGGFFKRLCQSIRSRECPKEVVRQCSVEAPIDFSVRRGLTRATARNEHRIEILDNVFEARSFCTERLRRTHPPRDICRHRHGFHPAFRQQELARKIPGKTGIRNPGEVDTLWYSGKELIEFFVANSVRLGPIEIYRADTFIHPRDFTTLIADRKLGAVTAVVEYHTVTRFCTTHQPLKVLHDGLGSGATVCEKPNVIFIEAAMTDEKLRHVGHVINATLQLIARIGVYPNQKPPGQKAPLFSSFKKNHF